MNEELEVKDIEWLKARFRGRKIFKPQNDREIGYNVAIDEFSEYVDQLDQLDEREQLEIAYKDILSRGEFWFDDKEYVVVEKQELPVIPKFVANWIEETKKQYKTLIFAFTHIYAENEIGESPSKEEKRLYQWMESADNEEVFARAWLDGFMVETEQKYYVINNDQRMMLVRMMDGKTITEADPFKLEDMYEGEKKSHRLTEQEIKDYDPRYWAFRKPVEELEG